MNNNEPKKSRNNITAKTSTQKSAQPIYDNTLAQKNPINNAVFSPPKAQSFFGYGDPTTGVTRASTNYGGQRPLKSQLSELNLNQIKESADRAEKAPKRYMMGTVVSQSKLHNKVSFKNLQPDSTRNYNKPDFAMDFSSKPIKQKKLKPQQQAIK